MTAVVRRIDVGIVIEEIEEQVIRAVKVRRSRPIGAVVANTVQTAIVKEAITRSRVPDGLVGTKLAGEVHASIGVIVWIVTKVRT